MQVDTHSSSLQMHVQSFHQMYSRTIILPALIHVPLGIFASAGARSRNELLCIRQRLCHLAVLAYALSRLILTVRAPYLPMNSASVIPRSADLVGEQAHRLQ